MTTTHVVAAVPVEAPSEALRSAVARVGSQSAMGRLLGVTQRAVWRWLKERKHLPAEHVLTVEQATGISRHALRPDLYPEEPPVPAATGIAPPPPPAQCDRRGGLQLGEPVR